MSCEIITPVSLTFGPFPLCAPKKNKAVEKCRDTVTSSANRPPDPPAPAFLGMCPEGLPSVKRHDHGRPFTERELLARFWQAYDAIKGPCATWRKVDKRRDIDFKNIAAHATKKIAPGRFQLFGCTVPCYRSTTVSALKSLGYTGVRDGVSCFEEAGIKQAIENRLGYERSPEGIEAAAEARRAEETRDALLLAMS